MPASRSIRLLVLLASACAVTTLAQDRSKSPRKSVQVRVMAIRATRSNSEISPALRELADTLKRQFKFTGFKLEANRSQTTEIGKTFSTALIGGYSANVTPKSIQDRRVTLQVQVLKGTDSKSKVDQTMNLGETILYIFPLAGEDQLIVGVSAR